MVRLFKCGKLKVIFSDDLPDHLDKFFDHTLHKFSKAHQVEFKKIDKEIGTILHSVYKPKLGQNLAKAIFKYLDSYLGTKRSPIEAKNCKKLLASVQKASLLHPAEIAALFDKADRFINKQSIKKEKMEIKNEIREKVILEGVKPIQDENPESKMKTPAQP